MNKAFKGGNVLWVSVTTISLLCAAGILFLMFQERSKRIETEQELLRMEQARKAVEKRLDNKELELIQLKDKARILAAELEQEKRNARSALEELDKKSAQLKNLESDLANEKKQRTNLADELAQLRENYDRLDEQLLKQANLKLEQTEGRRGKFTGKKGVELKKIVVKPKKKLSAKVLVVNREFHFVVIDMGRNDGVHVGDEFAVYSGSEKVGKVQVEKVYDAMSTAAILSGSQELEIQEDSIIKSF